MKKTLSIALILLIVVTSFAFAGGDSIKVEVNKKELLLDVEAIMLDDQPLVPLRGVFEALGLEVTWDGINRVVTGENKDTLVELEIDDINARVNGKELKLDSLTVIINGRTMVAINLMEEIGAEVIWDKEEKLISINKSLSQAEDYKKSLTFSNLLDQGSQDQVREAMETAGILSENIDFFFEELNYYNSVIEGRSLVENGFTTIDSLQAQYDLIEIQDMWDKKNPIFIGYNCRITTYALMKDAIKVGKPGTSASDWLIFDGMSLDYNPKEVFSPEEREKFYTLYSHVPTELTKDISVHIENIKKDWESKGIEFLDEDKRSVVSVFFHEEEGFLFIGHMGLLISTQDGKLLFIEKLSFLEPYQAIKFDNRTDLNDYLMNKYDISWGQPTAKPIIMENDKLLEGYREKPSSLESDSE